ERLVRAHTGPVFLVGDRRPRAPRLGRVEKREPAGCRAARSREVVLERGVEDDFVDAASARIGENGTTFGDVARPLWLARGAAEKLVRAAVGDLFFRHARKESVRRRVRVF